MPVRFELHDHDIDGGKSIPHLRTADLIHGHRAQGKNFEDKNWFDIYRYKMLLLKKINDETRILDDFVDMIDLKTDDLENKLNEQINKLKTANLRKNFYILTSIFSQITSLLFLLLLFRSFIRK